MAQPSGLRCAPADPAPATRHKHQRATTPPRGAACATAATKPPLSSLSNTTVTLLSKLCYTAFTIFLLSQLFLFEALLQAFHHILLSMNTGSMIHDYFIICPSCNTSGCGSSVTIKDFMYCINTQTNILIV